MPRRYIAFDIETSKEIPGEDFNWRPHRPLGISCAATLASDSGEPRVWFSKTTEGTPGKQMSRGDVQELVRYLGQMSSDGYSVLTWNGLGFDFDILSEESGAFENCSEIALGHVDMMFHVFCSLGYPVSLDKAAQGAGLPGKTAGMSGDQAPTLWAQGHYQKVLDYVAQDVRVAMEIAQTCELRKRFEWITRKGTKSSLPLANGWLTVEESLKLAQPDTSWMSSPLHRADFTNWLAPHR